MKSGWWQITVVSFAASALVGVGAALAMAIEWRAVEFIEPLEIVSWIEFLGLWTTVAGGSVFFAIFGLAAALLYRGDALRQRRRAELALAENTWLRAAADATGAGLLAMRPADGGILMTGGLAAFIDADRAGPPDYKALLDALGPSDRQRLESAVRMLRQHGAGFELTLHGQGDASRFVARGRRIAEPGAGDAPPVPLCDLIVTHDVTDRTEAEIQRGRIAHLEAERDAYRVMLDTLPVPVWRRRRDLAVVHANNAYLSALADARDQVRRHGAAGAGALPEMLGGPQAGQGPALAQRALDSGRAVSEQYHVVVGGDRRLWTFCEHPLPHEAGLAGYALDITAVEVAERELRRHVEAHKKVLAPLATAICIFGPDQRLIFFNDAYAQMNRLEEDWLSTEPTMGEVLEALRERRRLSETSDFPAFKAAQVALFTDLLEPQEELLHLPDETTVRMVVAPHPFGGVVFAYEDVTDKLALERSFNTLIDVQRATLDHLFEAICVFGSDGRLKLSNPVWVELWDIEPESLVGEPHLNDILQRMRPFFDGEEAWLRFRSWAIAQLGQVGDPQDRTAVPSIDKLERSDGTVLTLASEALPDGGVMFSFQDITDTTQAARALRERNEALEAADKLKSEFIGNVSYELRTPLAAIIGFADILSNQYFGPLNDRQLDYGRNILDSANRLLGLVNDLLDLATIEAGHRQLAQDAVDIHTLLAGVMALSRERLRRIKLSVDFDCAPDVGEVTGDHRRLKQAFYNLVSHTLSRVPAGGRICVSARRLSDEGSADRLIVSIWGAAKLDPGAPRMDDMPRDSGPDAGAGVEIDVPPTDAGLQAHPDDASALTLPDGAGDGLGLSLVRSVMELHGGNVTVEAGSVGDRVSCFLPALPLAQLQLELPDPRGEGGMATSGIPDGQVVRLDADREAAGEGQARLSRPGVPPDVGKSIAGF